jgi:hypothetical protein
LVRRCSGGQPSNKYKFKKIKLIVWSGFFFAAGFPAASPPKLYVLKK